MAIENKLKECEIADLENTIAISGRFDFVNVRHLLAVLYRKIHRSGFQEIILDFGRCSATFPRAMLPICSKIIGYRHEGIDFSLIVPDDSQTARLFVNTRWDKLIEPTRKTQTTYTGKKHVPAYQFQDENEQMQAVHLVLEAILETVSGVSRDDLAALEWSLTEITDNVLSHSESKLGGLLQLTSFHTRTRIVEYVVCDNGIGIPTSIRRFEPKIRSDTEALRSAINEGFTSRQGAHQGNGLFGSYQVSRISNGGFSILSGRSTLHLSPKGVLQVTTNPVPYDGTTVVAGIGLSTPELLAKALRFKGREHRPTDYIEIAYEQQNNDDMIIRMIENSSSFGTRATGAKVRKRIENLLRMKNADSKILIDFERVGVVSSSFADEVFGRLFVGIGEQAFKDGIVFLNINCNISSLISRSIELRKRDIEFYEESDKGFLE